MQKLMLLLMAGVWAMPALAGGPMALPVPFTRASQPAGKTLWRASVLAMVGANVMDARSSWGKNELNPNLSGNIGSFGREGSLIKLGIVSGIFVLEAVLLRHHPSSKLYHRLALINFGSASVTGGIAIRNFGIPQR